MAGNGTGNARQTRADNMRLFDKMPLSLRRLMNYAVGNWHTGQVLDWHLELVNRLGKSSQQATAIITREIVLLHEPEKTYETYGPDHPEADSHGRDLRPDKQAVWSLARR
jgi:hypothetical protein